MCAATVMMESQAIGAICNELTRESAKAYRNCDWICYFRCKLFDSPAASSGRRARRRRKILRFLTDDSMISFIENVFLSSKNYTNNVLF